MPVGMRGLVTPGRRRVAFILILALLMALHMWPYFQATAWHIDAELGSAFLAIVAAHVVGALPGGSAALWSLVAAVLLVVGVILRYTMRVARTDGLAVIESASDAV